MTSSFVIVCISTQMISESFRSQLFKTLKDLNLQAQNETRSNDQLFVDIGQQDFNHELLDSSLVTLASLHQVDIALIPRHIYHAEKKLVIFDMDSTLITGEVIDEMAMRHGVGEQVKLITKKAMNGDLNFDQSLTERVALLKGFHRKHMEEILKELKFTPGTVEFIRTLRNLGIKTAIASGGFRYFAENIRHQLKMDETFANDLEFDGDLLTGKIFGPIVNAEKKAEILSTLARKYELKLDQVVAIGDGANDIPMLLKAGLGIAIHAKEKVQKNAHYRINFGPMTHASAFMKIGILG